MRFIEKLFGVGLLTFSLLLAASDTTIPFLTKNKPPPKKSPIDTTDHNSDNGDEDDQTPTAPLNIDGPFMIRPYVFSFKGEKIDVAWSYKDKSSIKDKIELKLTKGGAVQSVMPELDQNIYVAELPIPTCDFGEDVAYSVTGMGRTQLINNIPCPGHLQDTTRFVFMSDTQEGTEFVHKFAEQTAKYNGSAVLLGGDLVQTGSILKEWVSFFDAMDPAIRQVVLFPAAGNHEYKKDLSAPFWKYFFRTPASEAFYAADIGDVHVMALNSNFVNDPSLKAKQLSWLMKELAKPARWRIVFFHHPGYSKEIMNSSHYPKKEYLVIRQYYIPLFEKYGVDLVLNGHTHIFEHSAKNGVQYLTMGPAGGRLGIYGAKNPYSLKTDRIRTIVELEVSYQALRAVTTTIEGKTIDELNLIKK